MNESDPEHPSTCGTIPRLVLAAADWYGDQVALEEGDRRWTFRELSDGVLDSAAAYIAAGLRPGDRVGIWAQNSADWIFAALGAQSAGGVLVPLSTRFKGAEAAWVLEKSGTKMLVSVESFLETRYLDMLADASLPSLDRRILLTGCAENATTWSAFLGEGAGVSRKDARARALAVGPDDLADIMFTSGTTGNPKGVMMGHQQNLTGYDIWSGINGITEGDRYLIVNPFFHAFGYKAGWLCCLIRGATILPHAVFDVSQVLERVARDRISILPGPPAIYQSILMHPDRKKFDLSSLRLAITGAAAIPPEMIRRIRKELGFDTVLTGYGLTETAGLATHCRQGDDDETVALTSGKALPGVSVQCVDDAGKVLPAGESGEIWVRGPNVMRGYFEDEAATRETIDSDGWLHTGDIGWLDEQGYIRITDRMKDMFIMGGFNCYPAEIEKLMFEMPEIGEVSVIGIPDERMGEVGMAFVVKEPGTQPTEASVIAWCRESMSNYKVPRQVEFVEDLPRTPSGKIQKFVLRERAEHALESAAPE